MQHCIKTPFKKYLSSCCARPHHDSIMETTKLTNLNNHCSFVSAFTLIADNTATRSTVSSWMQATLQCRLNCCNGTGWYMPLLLLLLLLSGSHQYSWWHGDSLAMVIHQGLLNLSKFCHEGGGKYVHVGKVCKIEIAMDYCSYIVSTAIILIGGHQ